MTINVATRLIGQATLAVVLCVLVGLSSVFGKAAVSTHRETLSATTEALRNHQDGDMMHDALRGDVLFSLIAQSDEERSQVATELAEHAEWFREVLGKNEGLDLGAEVHDALGGVRPTLDAYIKGAESLVSMASKDQAGAREALPGFLEMFGELEEKMEAVSDTIQARAKSAESDLAEADAATRHTTIGIGVVAGGIIIVLSVLTVRSILKPLRECMSVLEACGKGDLTARVKWAGKDEFGALASATNTLSQNFGSIISEVQRSAVEVASAATEIASSANEMSAAVSDVAKQTTRTAESASASGQTAQEGGSVVEQTIEGMEQINTSVLASAASVTELGARGREIGEIIRVINDIADQTNLLALNAAIEAARAGEHGRGFAVVADEVRKLAERTTKATEEVGRSIQSIQKETEQAVTRMHSGTEHVKAGVLLAKKAGESLREIVSGASDVAGMVQSISAAAEEAGAGANESAGAAAQLSTKAEQLQDLVRQFKIGA